MPFLSIRRSAALETRRRTQRFSVSNQKRRYCRFTRNRRLVLLLAWETLFPTIGPLPVTSHTRAISTPIKRNRLSLASGHQPVLAPASPRQKGGGNPIAGNPGQDGPARAPAKLTI